MRSWRGHLSDKQISTNMAAKGKMNQVIQWLKVQILTWLKCCGETLEELSANVWKPHEWKQRRKDEWAEMSSWCSERLIKSQEKLLLQVTATKAGSTGYWIKDCTFIRTAWVGPVLFSTFDGRSRSCHCRPFPKTGSDCFLSEELKKMGSAHGENAICCFQDII